MTRAAAIAAAEAYFDEGGFAADLARRVATLCRKTVAAAGQIGGAGGTQIARQCWI